MSATPEDREIAFLESELERLQTYLGLCEEYILDHPSGDEILEIIYKDVD